MNTNSKQLQEQINNIKKDIMKLQRIWELQYLIKSKVEKEIYKNPNNQLHINITDITNTETILNSIMKRQTNE